METNPQGWPANSVGTAGGYHIVPDGNTAWRIFAPGQNPGDTANTGVSGDPHVAEKDGTRWDFTKSSDFVLGDGTRIFAQTSAETGHSVTTGLDIVNGADHVKVSNLQGAPTLSPISQDGYEWRAAHIAQDPNRDTFFLRGDQNNVNWVRERNGRLDGTVTGATYDAKTDRYEQTVDGNPYVPLDASLRPPFGSRAWGNQLRGELDDRQAEYLGQVANAYGVPGAGILPAVQNAAGIHADHNLGAYQADQRDLQSYYAQIFGGGFGGAFGGGFGGGFGFGSQFGGWGSYFGSFNQGFDALSYLRQLFLNDNSWQLQAQLGMQQNLYI